MAKRMLAAALAAVMTASMLVGCGSSGDSGNKDANAGNTSNAMTDTSGDASGGEIEHIIMTYLTVGMTPQDLGKVQDAVNEISREKIGVEVEFKDVAIPDTFSNYSLWIGSGEQIDLMQIAFQGINNYVNSGQLLALDDMMKNDTPWRNLL